MPLKNVDLIVMWCFGKNNLRKITENDYKILFQIITILPTQCYKVFSKDW